MNNTGYDIALPFLCFNWRCSLASVISLPVVFHFKQVRSNAHQIWKGSINVDCNSCILYIRWFHKLSLFLKYLYKSGHCKHFENISHHYWQMHARFQNNRSIWPSVCHKLCHRIPRSPCFGHRMSCKYGHPAFTSHVILQPRYMPGGRVNLGVGSGWPETAETRRPWIPRCRWYEQIYWSYQQGN